MSEGFQKNIQNWVSVDNKIKALQNQVKELRSQRSDLTTNIFSSSFYVLTGFHGLHVFIGVVLLLALWGIGQRQKGLTLEGGMNLEFVALYWHFVDIVWIVLFTVVYLI